MGRFVTDLAAVVANADNLPRKENLPDVSIWDAFLPKTYTDRPPVQKKPIDPTVGMRVYREFYNVKKDKDGKKLIVAHKNGDGSNKGAVMIKDVKKNGNGGNGNGGKGGSVKDNAGGDKKDNGGGAAQKPADAEWTTEDDEKLRAMKAEGKTWKDIVAALGRPKKAIQNRWKEIGHGSGDDAGAEKKDEAKKPDEGDGGSKDRYKKGEKSSKKDNKPGDRNAAKAPSKAPSRSGSGEARFTMGEWMTLQEDDIFSFGELQCLSELIMRDERQRWLRVASAFADTTGRRVHPDDIRDKFEQIGRMG